MPFDELCGLRKIKKVEYVSVQKGCRKRTTEAQYGFRFVAGQTNVSASMDFIDTASVLGQLRSSYQCRQRCSALGRCARHPNLGSILCFVPEWRWGIKTTHTPWYPSMRIFRQEKPWTTGNSN